MWVDLKGRPTTERGKREEGGESFPGDVMTLTGSLVIHMPIPVRKKKIREEKTRRRDGGGALGPSDGPADRIIIIIVGGMQDAHVRRETSVPCVRSVVPMACRGDRPTQSPSLSLQYNTYTHTHTHNNARSLARTHTFSTNSIPLHTEIRSI